MRLTNPASHPELLKALAIHFIDSGYDLKELIRTICRSRVYQLSSHPNLHNGSDDRNFSRHYPRRFPAEVLLDAIDQIAGTETTFPGQPSGTRAVQLPDDSSIRRPTFFPSSAGRITPPHASAKEPKTPILPRACILLNSPHIHEKLTDSQARAARLATDPERTHQDKIRELYHRAYAREPDKEGTGRRHSAYRRQGERRDWRNSGGGAATRL